MNANTADTNQLPEDTLQLENMTTEQKILAAAEQEFLDKGFSGARTTAIAQAAGVTHAMLHYYFRSKDKLFEKIITDKMSELGKLMLDSLITSNLPLFEKIRTIITGHLDFIGANPKLPFFFVR
ncbi:MAG: TetR/AcrR family transcriptional regulator, partial [Muribaculaceae bacterium]|nr:TetR/AcrR family transcriptional regulator [Muribaculaceae bacterium]